MTRKRLLNVTSRKKRNGMLTFSNQSGGALTAITQTPLVIPGGVGGTLGWINFRATAMDINSDAGAANTIALASQRTAQTCYMRGFSEHIRVETNTGNPWFHRRICYTTKDDTFNTRNAADASGTQRDQVAQGAIETSSGWQRLAANMTIETLPQTFLGQKGVLFKGAEGVDWDDVIVAPVDTTRVTLKSDKTYVYKSGNERGILREHKLWHPMNKNLVYDDDESGQTEQTNNTSVQDNRGMGDYYVLDIFSQGASGSTADKLSIRYNSTLYWHEK